MSKTAQEGIERRLDALEERLTRLETLLTGVADKLEHYQLDTGKATKSIQQWVTDYVSLRLQQLVPETCAHSDEPEATEGPYLPATTIRCTEEVIHRVGRIPIPFVRQMVVQKVAQQARTEGVDRVDIAFFERAATF
jgi:hypothetical protein